MSLPTLSRMYGQDVYPRLSQPILDPLVWSFALHGKTRHPLILSYSDIQALGREEVTCSPLCAGDLFNAAAVESATWSGVPIRRLVDSVDIQPEARYVVIHNTNGYSTSLSLERFMNGILALEQDGEVLSPAQGFPARLIIPGLYSYKMPRWVTRIEFTDVRQGFWEERGWEDDGLAPTIAATTFPYHRGTISNSVVFEGFAFSADYPVSGVEISIDHADWMPTEFVSAAPAQLVSWQIPWTPPAPGDYGIRVRAKNASGFVQETTSPQFSVFPVLLRSLHSIVVHVSE